MRWLSCHFGTLRHNEQTKVGTWNKFGRLVIQIKNNIWVIESSQRRPPSPIIDTPQKVTKMIVLPLLLIRSSDTSAFNAFLDYRGGRQKRGLDCFAASDHRPLPPPLWHPPLTITLPIRAVTAQNQPQATAAPPLLHPLLQLLPWRIHVWTFGRMNESGGKSSDCKKWLVKISQRNNRLGVNSTNWSASSILCYPMIGSVAKLYFIREQQPYHKYSGLFVSSDRSSLRNDAPLHRVRLGGTPLFQFSLSHSVITVALNC